MAANPLIELKDISKRFGGVQALDKAKLDVIKGEVHGLVGENGAGKSTLMKILSGAERKDSGTIIIDDEKIDIHSPKDSIKKGIAIIYQEFMLAPDISVAENIFIDRLATGSPIINWKNLRAESKKLLISLGFGVIDPKMKVSDLSVAHQQIVEICKALSRNARVLILDEPTAVLTYTDIEKTFELIKKLSDRGVSVIYISHRLEEIFKICHRVTVMKDGKYVKTLDIEKTYKNELISHMIGRKLSDLYPKRGDCIIDEVAVEVNDLHAGPLVKNISFKVKKGEVLGFGGLVGSGRTETMRAIFGADKIESGEVIYFGKKTNFKTPKMAVRKKLGLLPEDRKNQGVLLTQSIRTNTTLASMRHGMNRYNIFDRKKEIKFVKNVLKELNTKYSSTEDKAFSLSGGNQQKISLSKWFAAKCDVIILDEPTRGVDVGAKTEIYRSINELATRGVAVIMISSEMMELIGMCDKVIVMRHGEKAGELERKDLNEEYIINLAMGEERKNYYE